MARHTLAGLVIGMSSIYGHRSLLATDPGQEIIMGKSQSIDVGVASKLGKYSDAVLSIDKTRWLHTSGTPGLDADGGLPADFETQARLAWTHVIAMLDAAGMGAGDIVKLTQSLIRRSDLEAYRAIRNEFLGDARPASMLSFVSGLATPDMLIEIEVIAAK